MRFLWSKNFAGYLKSSDNIFIVISLLKLKNIAQATA